jgi:hypothetical protein
MSAGMHAISQGVQDRYSGGRHPGGVDPVFSKSFIDRFCCELHFSHPHFLPK